MRGENITERITATVNDLYSEFGDMYVAEDFYAKYQKLSEAGNSSSRPSILAELYEMFNHCGINFESGRENSYYKKLIDAATANLNSEDLPDKIFRALYRHFDFYPTPTEYMARIVNRLEDKNDVAENDSLRLRILKRFIKYGNYLVGGGFGGKKVIQKFVENKLQRKVSSDDEVLKNLDDGIFEVLENADKAQKKPEGKFGLIKLADDLAGGKFRAGGATKKGLYLFAAAYNMTYAPDDKSIAFNPETDLEKNLFRDYYTNNLMRYLTDKAREYESDPAGIGINYKNFAETVYLYFIAGNFTPQEKIEFASAMIERLKINSASKNYSTNVGTSIFKSRFLSENILNRSVTDFENFVRENYNCSTRSENHVIGIMQAESEQKTAFTNYTQILQKASAAGIDLKTCNYGLFWADVPYLENINRLKSVLPDSEPSKLEKFLELLRGINKFLGGLNPSEKRERDNLSEQKNKFLYISAPQEMTRTAIITAYYYYYNGLHENDARKSFLEFFRHFKGNLDLYLENSGYTPFSVKNIFDLATAFSSYAYIYG